MFNFALCPYCKKADTIPVTPELFNKVLDSPIVANTCLKIAEQSVPLGSPDQYIREQAQKKVSELKASLPAFCWHATYRKGKRKNYDAIPSGLAIMDYDHIDDPKAIFDKIRDKALALNLVAAHVTPSCAGLRLVFAMPHGSSIADFQAFVARSLAIPGNDSCVHDLARISFAVTRSYWLFIDNDALFGEKPMQLKPVSFLPSNTLPLQRLSPADPTLDPAAAIPPYPKRSSISYDKAYKGIPYSKILECLEYLHGGKPVHSVRNMTIFAMACCVRTICNNDPDWVASIIPDYGEAKSKWYATIRSACNRPLPAQISPLLVKALEMARNSMSSTHDPANDKVTLFSTPLPPEMPDELPDLVSLLIKNVPVVCRPSVAHGIFPPLATHIHGVRFNLIDGSKKEPTLICINMARQSSGKSAINMPVQYICADIKERDERNRKREQEWKDACNANKGAKKDNPPRPTDLVVQCLISDMTNAALVQKALDAGEFPLYSNLNELEYLKQLQINGSKDIGKLLCIDYDNAEFGQERVGPQSVTGHVILRWNINAASTIHKGINFFKNNMIDGTLSRINFCTILRDNSQDFLYGTYDDDYANLLKPYITNLNLANGEIVCQQALDLAKSLQKRCVEMCEMADDDIMYDFIYRAVDIAYMKSMILYIAQDRKWDDRIERFTEWSLFYDLWCKNYFFGAKLDDENAMENIKQRPGQANLLDCLPDRFSIEVVSQLRTQRGMTPNPNHMLSNWVSRGFVTYDYASEQYHKTEKYLRK
ncbi:MAG: hypothetical protein MJ002_05655 [Paludibacteraceae bacterium]|nr:hypothetical protein [Paludibacteraceae bacterium]